MRATSGACSARPLVPFPPGWNEDVHSLGPGGQGDNLVRMKQQVRRRLNAWHSGDAIQFSYTWTATWEKYKLSSFLSFCVLSLLFKFLKKLLFGVLVEAAKSTPLPIQESKVQWGNVLSSQGELYTHLLSSLAPGKSAGFLVSERLSSNVIIEVLAAHSEQKLQRLELNILAGPAHFPAQPWLWTREPGSAENSLSPGQAPCFRYPLCASLWGADVLAFQLILEYLLPSHMHWWVFPLDLLRSGEE